MKFFSCGNKTVNQRELSDIIYLEFQKLLTVLNNRLLRRHNYSWGRQQVLLWVSKWLRGNKDGINCQFPTLWNDDTGMRNARYWKWQCFWALLMLTWSFLLNLKFIKIQQIGSIVNDINCCQLHSCACWRGWLVLFAYKTGLN